MEIFAGTQAGIFVITAAGAEKVLDSPEVRHLCHIDKKLLAATANGIYLSEDGGKHWLPSDLRNRQVWQIQPAADQSIYAATQPAGLFRSTDGGTHWSEIASFIQHPDAKHWCVPVDPPLPGRARALVIDARNPNRLRVGVEVGGIMKSDDGGCAWELTRPGDNPDIHVLLAHPEDPSELYVSTGYGRSDGIAEMLEGNAGVFRSTDGGESWQYRWTGVSPRYTRPMCIDPRPPYPLTVGSAPSPFSACSDPGGAGAYLFRSDDRGASWYSIGDQAHAPSSANFHGLVPSADKLGSVLVGTDAGEIWQVDAKAHWQCLASGLPWVMSLMDCRL